MSQAINNEKSFQDMDDGLQVQITTVIHERFGGKITKPHIYKALHLSNARFILEIKSVKIHPDSIPVFATCLNMK